MKKDSNKKLAFTLPEGATHVENCHSSRRVAFTLAEVLITLAIIGIVSALTIPTLIQKYTNLSVETKLKRIYSLMNQVILFSEIDNGAKELWPSSCNGENELSCENYYQKYILPYLKTSKVKNIEINSQGNVLIYLMDGSLLIGKNTEDYFFYPNANHYDENEFFNRNEDNSYSRPAVGKSCFAFRFAPQMKTNETFNSANKFHIGKNFDVYMYYLEEITEETLIEGSMDTRYGCREDAPYKMYCTALIKMNNWKIPKNYPFKVKN